MVGGNRTGTTPRSIQPHRIHAAGRTVSAGPAEREADLQSVVPLRFGNTPYHRPRQAQARRGPRISGRAPYLESKNDAEPSLIMPAIIILLILKEQLRLVFGATPLQNQLTCPPKPLQNAANRFCI